MERKIDILVRRMKRGNYRGAIALANRFHDLGDHQIQIERAHGAYTNPSLYKQLGYDIETLKADGQKALEERYADYLK